MIRAVRCAAVLATLVLAATASAHVTPPVLLASDRDVLAGQLAGAQRFFVREVRLTPGERQAIQKQTGWSPDEDFYRFYIGRDAQGRTVAATIFLSEYTVHGAVRVAVSLGPDGTVKGATVVELTEETYPWVKPLLDAQARYVATSQGQGRLDAMGQFYGQLISSLIQRASLLYDVGVIKRGDAA
ncbi:MAG: hypothetical protein DMD91_00935 [Candidatus Rokuibacteriota bacterium]|nr:MAG: hypothetical protein DMD91_00935 [Candidatus Rokubacteria bacterium]